MKRLLFALALLAPLTSHGAIIYTNTFANVRVQTNATVGGNFFVSGTTALSGNLSVSSNIGVGGSISLSGTTNVLTDNGTSLLRNGTPITGSVTNTSLIIPLAPSILPLTSFARLDSGLAPLRLLYAQGEIAYYQFVLPDNYASNAVVKLSWSAVSATSGSVSWSAAIWAYTPGSAADANIASFDTDNTVTTTVPGVAGRGLRTSITCTNSDSMVAGDRLQLRITRSDTSATGDASLTGVTFSYTPR